MRILPVVVLAVLMSGCSTIMNNGSQSMTITPSEGDDVKARITTPSGSYNTEIPTTVTADPSTGSGVSVMITDERYDSSEVEVGKSITGSFWANFLLFGLFPIGMGVDAASGAMWDYDNQIVIPLEKVAAP